MKYGANEKSDERHWFQEANLTEINIELFGLEMIQFDVSKYTVFQKYGIIVVQK